MDFILDYTWSIFQMYYKMVELSCLMQISVGIKLYICTQILGAQLCILTIQSY
jgi:hypothetical protein